MVFMFEGVKKVCSTTLNSTVNGAAHCANRIGVGSTKDFIETQADGLDLNKIRERRSAPLPTDAQIDAQIDEFSQNLINHTKKTLYTKLDESGQFFLVRWIVKGLFLILLPLLKKNVHSATHQVFEKPAQFKEFDLLMKNDLTTTNETCEKWIALLHSVAKDYDGSIPLTDAIDKALAKTGTKEFFQTVTENIAKKYFSDISLGRLVYNKLMSLPVVFVLFFPLALTFRILFLIPDFLSSRIMTAVMTRIMSKYELVENLLENVIYAVKSNEELTNPLFEVVNESLEEVLLDIAEDKVSSQKLSDETRKALMKNLELTRDAVALVGEKTVKDLENRIKLGLPLDVRMSALFDSESGQGFEQVMGLIYERLHDPEFVQKKTYSLCEKINRSLSSGTEGKELEKRTVDLVKKLLTTAITKKIVAGNGKKIGLGDGAAINMISNLASKQIYETIGKTLELRLSKQFLNFQINHELTKNFINNA